MANCVNPAGDLGRKSSMGVVVAALFWSSRSTWPESVELYSLLLLGPSKAFAWRLTDRPSLFTLTSPIVENVVDFGGGRWKKSTTERLTFLSACLLGLPIQIHLARESPFISKKGPLHLEHSVHSIDESGQDLLAR